MVRVGIIDRPGRRESRDVLQGRKVERDELNVRRDSASEGTRRSGRARTHYQRANFSGGLARLVQARYVAEQAVSMDAVLYLITDLGRNALKSSKT
jgi:hypothetical protein